MIETRPSPDADVASVRAPNLSFSMPEVDSLRCKVTMPYRAMFYPLGFPVEVMTNEESVLTIVEQCWGGLRQLHTNATLQVRIIVSEGGSDECPPTPVLRAQRNVFTVVADAHNHAVCNLAHGFSLVWLSYASLQHPKYLCYHFIDTSAHILISTSYTTPIHAACVSRYGHGMLLSAVSGMGKSTLSYACARAGWTFTSDDGSFLLCGGNQPRVVGNCRQVRFRPTAKALFPELQGRDLTPRIQGKPSIEIPTSELGLTTSEQTTIHSIIFLNRQSSAAIELVPLPRGTAVRRFEEYLAPYPVEEVRDLQIATLQQLSEVDVYELRYRDLQSAIDRLDLLARSNSKGTTIV